MHKRNYFLVKGNLDKLHGIRETLSRMDVNNVNSSLELEKGLNSIDNEITEIEAKLEN